MMSSITNHSSTHGRALRLALALLLALTALVAIPGGPILPTAANADSHAPANNAVEQHFAWQPETSSWVTGQPKGYTEGESYSVATVQLLPRRPLNGWRYLCLEAEKVGRRIGKSVLQRCGLWPR